MIYHVGLANQMLAKFQQRCNGLMAEAHVFSIQLDMLQYCSSFMQHVYTSLHEYTTFVRTRLLSELGLRLVHKFVDFLRTLLQCLNIG